MSSLQIVKCPNKECPYYKDTGTHYQFSTRKKDVTQCGKCGKEFKI